MAIRIGNGSSVTGHELSVDGEVDAGRKAVVVFVDDEFPIVDAAKICMADTVELHTALNGSSALALIESGVCPDVLVCDYRMPQLDGLELVKRARGMLQHDVPAVIVTGDTAARETIEAAGLVRCRMLRKPFCIKELMRLIRIESRYGARRAPGSLA